MKVCNVFVVNCSVAEKPNARVCKTSKYSFSTCIWGLSIYIRFKAKMCTYTTPSVQIYELKTRKSWQFLRKINIILGTFLSNFFNTSKEVKKLTSVSFHRAVLHAAHMLCLFSPPACRAGRVCVSIAHRHTNTRLQAFPNSEMSNLQSSARLILTRHPGSHRRTEIKSGISTWAGLTVRES